MQTHNLEHKYKIAFDIIRRICTPRVESGKNYTMISVQDLVSYMNYEVGKARHENRKNVIPYHVVEQVKTLRCREELTTEHIKRIAKENNLKERQVRDVVYQDLSHSEL